MCFLLNNRGSGGKIAMWGKMSNRCFQGYMQKGCKSFTGNARKHRINNILVNTVYSLYLDFLYLDISLYVDGKLSPFRLLTFCLSTSRYPPCLDISLSRWSLQSKIALKSLSLCQYVRCSMACVDRFFTKSVFCRWFVIVC